MILVALFCLFSPAQTVSSAQPLAGPPVRIPPTVRCSPGNPVAPAYTGTIDLAPYAACNATAAGPWSGRLSPDGSELFVALSGLAGSFGTENCRVVTVDSAADVVTGAIAVGLFPEELAWTTAGNQLASGYVTNSTSGTLTVLDSAGSAVQTITLPDPLSFGSCFPFGIAVDWSQTRAYVGTVDGSGSVYAIDTALQTVETSETLAIPGAHGRLAFYGRTLVVPVTEFDPSFTSSEAKVVFVEPLEPSGAVTVTIPSFATFPTAQDVAVRCDGRVFLVGTGLGAEVHVLDAKTKTYLHSFPALTFGAAHQGLALSSEGQLAVASYSSQEIAFFDSWTEQGLAVVDLATLPDFHSVPEELVFSRDGKKLWAVCNGSDSLAVFESP